MVYCVQVLPDYQRQLADPQISERKREEVKEWIQYQESWIQIHKRKIVQFDNELAKIGKSRMEFLSHTLIKDSYKYD